jgi:hypothetical protein
MPARSWSHLHELGATTTTTTTTRNTTLGEMNVDRMNKFNGLEGK